MIQTIKKLRKLPAQGHILVQVGDLVQQDTPVGKLDYIPGQLTRYNVAQDLGIAPERMPVTLRKQVGQWVEAGEVLAATDEFFTTRTAASPKTGYVGLVSSLLGNVFIREPLPAGPKEPITIRAEEAGISLLKFAANAAVVPGQVVEKGRYLFGGGTSKNNVLSPVFGKVTDVSFREGTITIKPLYHPTEVLAHIKGIVTAVDPGEAVEVTTHGHMIQGVIGYGGERVGALQVMAAGHGNIQAEDVADPFGKVVVARGGTTLAALQACANRQAVGLVLGSGDYGILKEFMQSDPLETTGANADIPFTIILLNGFGDLPMAEDVFTELQQLDGQIASIDGSTQLRAGVVRPEVIVPIDSPLDEHVQGDINPQMDVGAWVMIIREPGFGVVGQVKALANRPQAVASGAQVATAIITEQGTGREWVVPRTNLKLLRGDV